MKRLFWLVFILLALVLIGLWSESLVALVIPTLVRISGCPCHSDFGQNLAPIKRDFDQSRNDNRGESE